MLSMSMKTGAKTSIAQAAGRRVSVSLPGRGRAAVVVAP
jgi:hypothetical protein